MALGRGEKIDHKKIHGPGRIILSIDMVPYSTIND